MTFDYTSGPQLAQMQAWRERSDSMRNNLRKEIEAAINRNSAERGSNTPDYVLASFLEKCLLAFDEGVNHRDAWYGHHLGLVNDGKDDGK